jgi:hypothetical protein
VASFWEKKNRILRFPPQDSICILLYLIFRNASKQSIFFIIFFVITWNFRFLQIKWWDDNFFVGVSREIYEVLFVEKRHRQLVCRFPFSGSVGNMHRLHPAAGEAASIQPPSKATGFGNRCRCGSIPRAFRARAPASPPAANVTTPALATREWWVATTAPSAASVCERSPGGSESVGGGRTRGPAGPAPRAPRSRCPRRVLQVVYLLARPASLLLVAITYPPPSLNHLPVHSGARRTEEIDTPPAAGCRAATWWRSRATSTRTAGTGRGPRRRRPTAPRRAASRPRITRRSPAAPVSRTLGALKGGMTHADGVEGR